MAPAAAIDMGAWMEWFRIWLDEEAEVPREEDYKNVLLRFQNENREFFNDLAFLLSLMREGRKEIEEEEQLGRYYMQFRDDYRVCNTYMVTTLEHRRRRQLVAEEEDARYHLFSDLRFMKQTLKWGARSVQVSLQHPSQKRPWNLRIQRFPVRHVHPSEDPDVTAAKKRYLSIPHQPVPTNPDDIYSYVHNGPSLPNILKGRLFPDSKTVAEVDLMTAEAIAAANEKKNAKKAIMPPLSIVDRFIAREEVIRAGIEVARKRELASFLGDYSLAFRAAIEREAFSTCLRRCGRIDRKFPGHPPLALSRFIAVEEAMARRALEEEAWAAYQEPLLAAHQQYLDGCISMQFTFGHLTMTSHANYFDRRLLKLLTERVRHVREKIDDLVELESASRTRLEYIAEITGEMRFKWKKLII